MQGLLACMLMFANELVYCYNLSGEYSSAVTEKKISKEHSKSSLKKKCASIHKCVFTQAK